MPSHPADIQRRKRARNQAEKAMVAAAGAGKPITYTDLIHEISAMVLRPSAPALTKLLCDISRTTHAQGRGLLSAVVINKRDHRPGPGFFKLAGQLGMAFDDEATFWHEQVEKVYAAYKT